MIKVQVKDLVQNVTFNTCNYIIDKLERLMWLRKSTCQVFYEGESHFNLIKAALTAFVLEKELTVASHLFMQRSSTNFLHCTKFLSLLKLIL